jgi:F-type H+-transporting ATPase subunit epsilon
MRNFVVDVLTPNRVVARDLPCQSLLIPTVRGQINVLTDHTHVITRLGTGELSVLGGADDPDRHFTITYGICKVLDNKVYILSNTCEEQHEIDEQRAEKALQNAQEILASEEGLSDDEIEKYRRKIERAQLRLQIAKKFKN